MQTISYINIHGIFTAIGGYMYGTINNEYVITVNNNFNQNNTNRNNSDPEIHTVKG